MMVRSGIRLFKFWFSISREEQLRRFLGRAQDPLKQWKRSPMDVESLGRWDSYTKAKEAMFFYTDTADAPWTVVRSDNKNRARLHAMRHVLHSLCREDIDVVKPPDRLVVGSAEAIYEHGEKPSIAPRTIEAVLRPAFRAIDVDRPGPRAAPCVISAGSSMAIGDFSLNEFRQQRQ